MDGFRRIGQLLKFFTPNILVTAVNSLPHDLFPSFWLFSSIFFLQTKKMYWAIIWINLNNNDSTKIWGNQETSYKQFTKKNKDFPYARSNCAPWHHFSLIYGFKIDGINRKNYFAKNVRGTWKSLFYQKNIFFYRTSDFLISTKNSSSAIMRYREENLQR